MNSKENSKHQIIHKTAWASIKQARTKTRLRLSVIVVEKYLKLFTSLMINLKCHTIPSSINLHTSIITQCHRQTYSFLNRWNFLSMTIVLAEIFILQLQICQLAIIILSLVMEDHHCFLFTACNIQAIIWRLPSKIIEADYDFKYFSILVFTLYKP